MSLRGVDAIKFFMKWADEVSWNKSLNFLKGIFMRERRQGILESPLNNGSRYKFNEGGVF